MSVIIFFWWSYIMPPTRKVAKRPKKATPPRPSQKKRTATPPKATHAGDKRTYVLHDPRTMEKIGQYVSRTPLGAAKKAVTQAASEGRNPNPIYLREVKTKKIREYFGQRSLLDGNAYRALKKKLVEDHGWHEDRVPRYEVNVKYRRVFPYDKASD